MNSASDFKIGFGPHARTLIYEDSNGDPVLITFDVDTTNGNETLILEPPSKSLIEADQLRINLAMDRAKQYFVSLGHKVRIFGE